MTYSIASIISCLLLPLFAFLGFMLSRKTIINGVLSEEGAQISEEIKRDRARNLREKQVRKLFSIYGVIVVLFFIAAALAEPARKVHAALWPSPTPTVTSTRTPTRTPTASRTPRSTNTLNPKGSTTITPTITGTIRPGTLVANSGGAVSIVIVQTRVVIQTHIVPITQVVYVPMTVIVIASNTPLVSTTPTQTYIPTETGTPTQTPSATTTPTDTVTYTLPPTFIIPTETETPLP